MQNHGQVPTQIKDTGFGYDDAEDGKNFNKKGGVTQSESRREDIVLPGERPNSAFSERMRAQAGLHSVRLAELNDNLACPRYLHDHLRAVWYSPALKRRMCYYCAETCTDNGLDLIGGLEEMDLVEEWMSVEAFDSKLRKLNTGHEMLLNLAMLRWLTCFTSTKVACFTRTEVPRHAEAILLLYYCFTAALLLLYCCFTAALLLLYWCLRLLY
jgi:hypothetical protein